MDSYLSCRKSYIHNYDDYGNKSIKQVRVDAVLRYKNPTR